MQIIPSGAAILVVNQICIKSWLDCKKLRQAHLHRCCCRCVGALGYMLLTPILRLFDWGNPACRVQALPDGSSGLSVHLDSEILVHIDHSFMAVCFRATGPTVELIEPDSLCLCLGCCRISTPLPVPLPLRRWEVSISHLLFSIWQCC